MGYNNHHEARMTSSRLTVTGARMVDDGDCEAVYHGDGSKPTMPDEDTSCWSNWLTCLHLSGDYVAVQVDRTLLGYDRKLKTMKCYRLL